MEHKVCYTEPLQPIKPTRFKVKLYKLFYFFVGPIGRFNMRRKFHKIEVEGLENLGRSPKLLLINHTSPRDPSLIMFFSRQALHFLVTEPVLHQGFLARVMLFLGQIPKRKLDNDFRAISLMMKWSKLGAHVALFPEGKFSWNCKPSPFKPGIPQLIKMLKVPVVPVSIHNGNKVKPLWAKNYRKTSIKIEFKPAIEYDSSTPNDQIENELREKIFPPDKEESSTTGNNLIEGFKELIRFCPSCFADSSLVESDDQVECKSCHAVWKIDTNNNLYNEDQQYSLDAIFDKTKVHLQKVWAEKEEFISREPVELLDITKLKWSFIEKGHLKLVNDCLCLGEHKFFYEDIFNYSTEWKDLIIIRTKHGRFGFNMPSESRFIWMSLFEITLGEEKCI